MNDIISILDEAKKLNKLVSIFIDPFDMSGCSVGFIDQVDDTAVRLKSISPSGTPAGYEVRFIKDIVRVDFDGKYEKKIEFLKNNSSPNVFNDLELVSPKKGNSIILSTLKESKKRNLVVTLWAKDEDDSIIGYVDYISTDVVKILCINDYGQEDGFVVLKTSEITMMDCNSQKNQIIEFLNKNWVKE